MKSISYGVLEDTPVGALMVAVSENGVLTLSFGGGEQAFRLNLKDRYGVEARRDPARVAGVLEQLSEYFEGSRDEFELEYDLDTTS